MDRFIPDIPRLYTGIAEWLGCMMILLIVPRRIGRAVFAVISASVLCILCAFLVFTVEVCHGLVCAGSYGANCQKEGNWQ